MSPDQENSFLKKILEQVWCGGDKGDEEARKKETKTRLTPAQCLVLVGLIGGVLEVNSVLVNKDQQVQIVLIGSLKRKTTMDKLLDSIGARSFDEVMRAIVGHFK
ncbi:MAG: hypothetical protein C4570_02160 [Ammonifex sp.]|nr:MAG: hypothetical protein C4570_02160 [Ammonifex sp.]